MPRQYPYPPTGVAQIDSAHRNIGDVIVRIHRATSDGDAHALLALVGQLERVVAEHFAEEEALMDRIGYPYRERHRAAHAAYRTKLGKNADDLRDTGLTADLLHFLANLDRWFRAHAIAEDQPLGAAVADARRGRP